MECLNKAMNDGPSWELEYELSNWKFSTRGCNTSPGDADPRQATTNPIYESRLRILF